jgi:transcriptional regulator with XRE-family HTH domain
VATPTLELEALRERIKQAPLMLLASRIRRARRTTGLSHDDFGKRAGGVTRQHLIKLEKGKHRPGPEMLLRISEASGRSVDWFLDPEVDPSPFPDGDGA